MSQYCATDDDSCIAIKMFGIIILFIQGLVKFFIKLIMSITSHKGFFAVQCQIASHAPQTAPYIFCMYNRGATHIAFHLLTRKAMQMAVETKQEMMARNTVVSSIACPVSVLVLNVPQLGKQTQSVCTNKG